jgi:hypothetical protein
MDSVQILQMQALACRNNRQFAITSATPFGLIALVPLQAKERDVVFIIHDFTVPHIVRLVAGDYLLVRDVFVYRIDEIMRLVFCYANVYSVTSSCSTLIATEFTPSFCSQITQFMSIS